MKRHREHPTARRARQSRAGLPLPLIPTRKDERRAKRARDARARDRQTRREEFTEEGAHRARTARASPPRPSSCGLTRLLAVEFAATAVVDSSFGLFDF